MRYDPCLLVYCVVVSLVGAVRSLSLSHCPDNHCLVLLSDMLPVIDRSVQQGDAGYVDAGYFWFGRLLPG